MKTIPNLTPKQIARYWAKVEKTSTCWNWLGSRTENGYGRYVLNATDGHLTHRFAWHLAGKELSESEVIDHRCRNKACVNPSHLRSVTGKQNQENRNRFTKSASGFRGVYLNTQTGRYQARATHNRKIYTAGHHATAEEANEAAIALRNSLYTHNDADRQPR